MSFLDDWWADQRAMSKKQRAEALAEDPGVPATYGTATGEPTPAPWSAVLGARTRLPIVINLNKLKASVMAALEKCK